MNTSLNRNADLNQLYDHCMERKNLLLAAANGMGKTRLLLQLQEKLVGRRICFSVSLRGMVSLQQFTDALINTVNSVAQNHPNVAYNLKQFFGQHAAPIGHPEKTELFLTALANCFEQMAKDFLFVLEDAHEWEVDYPLVDLLYRLAKPKNSQFLVSSSNTWLAPNDLPKMNLAPLHSENVEAPSLNEETKAELLQFSMGNAALFMELVEVIEEHQQTLPACKDILLERYHPTFSSFKSRFTSLQWRLLKAISKEEIVPQPHAFDFLVKHRLGAASSIERAIKNLADTGMARKTDEGWIVSNPLFNRWLQWVYQT